MPRKRTFLESCLYALLILAVVASGFWIFGGAVNAVCAAVCETLIEE